ncbi:MAG TPA: 2-succinyl-5-enolpyruvyl-6-hydroxy-3-cyclohexene-1-carboxylic-acid synthase [Erwinia sp.]|uniref:2-succinyl-5-enolpyruvyl-6-hydroxy-3- cyclohexene-1-carboxylic-acid synthase n=1 Tax=Erwinia citreus TaxID=558 RepID=UPI000E97FF50|nr:2-succinyl-5-enolpyruvyl-6-hydroxy-3-cyclohexene-1-carboxylic-acid synthase [Erwinia sp.]HBV38548.1 2-succinyl-5-enolpyruvyl-6-hydroxy-3-cyclohexene-1-carboxylic-acid synthase [Erwinia sp.]
MSHRIFNRRWAAVILEGLTRHGVQHISIAPGTRSAPLTLEAAAGHLICHTHFDERGLGYLALGLAKATCRPVAIVVTSGTAVANLAPAVIEASLTGERLIVLSADRPPELIDCGANQAITQPGIFASHAGGALNLPRPSADIPARWLVAAIDALLQQHPTGAVHINVPFAEPLYGEASSTFQAWHDALGGWWREKTPWLSIHAERATPVSGSWPGWRQKRGVIVAGKITAQQGVALAEWADTLGWPLLADIQSHTGAPFPCSELWLQEPQARQALERADIIIQFGARLTGKRLTSWLATAEPAAYWLIDPLPGHLDPAHHRSQRIVADIGEWLAAHKAVSQPAWLPSLQALALETHAAMAEKLREFGEAQLAQRLAELLPEQGVLFLGNSLTIRLANAFARLPAGYPVYASRGASGIDGLIATATGIQRGSARPLLAIVGDLSALYDVNSLALTAGPLVLIVVNNGGGQIFSLLPTPEKERERFFTLPQQASFASAAAMFGLTYHQPADWSSLRVAVEAGWRSTAATLIELKVEAGVQWLAGGWEK